MGSVQFITASPLVSQSQQWQGAARRDGRANPMVEGKLDYLDRATCEERPEYRTGWRRELTVRPSRLHTAYATK